MLTTRISDLLTTLDVDAAGESLSNPLQYAPKVPQSESLATAARLCGCECFETRPYSLFPSNV